jgi:hypothetical protein
MDGAVCGAILFPDEDAGRECSFSGLTRHCSLTILAFIAGRSTTLVLGKQLWCDASLSL